jgi:hypothetical protein
VGEQDFLFFFKLDYFWHTFHVLSVWASLQVARERREYQHEDNDIANTQLTWLPLNNCSMTHEREPYMFYNLSCQFAHELHYIGVGPPTKRWYEKEMNINTRTVALQTHNLCGSPWIIAQWPMKGIRLFCITFPASLHINYTTSNLATYLEVALGSSKYHHQDGCIPNTGIRLVLLDRGSMVNERDPSILYNLSWQFAHELHYFKVGITQKRH